MTQHFWVLGLSYHKSPVELRESFALNPGKIKDCLAALQQQFGAHEAVLLSTCNRTELYAKTPQPDMLFDFWKTLAHQTKLQHSDLKKHLYTHQNAEGVAHLLRVASGLDSLVMGEPQIFGQMKDAYELATEVGSVDKYLHKLFQTSFTVAKKIRTETAIGKSTISVASTAVKLALHVFQDFKSCTVFLVGAGDTIRLTARHLKARGVQHIVVLNRSLQAAQHIAREINATAMPLEELSSQLHLADICISATQSADALIHKKMVEEALLRRKHRPMLMIDLAVPRDIAPEVAQLNDVYLYNVDDLSSIIEKNQNNRAVAASEAEKLITEALQDWQAWCHLQQHVPAIQTLRSWSEQKRDELLQRALRQIENGEPAAQVLTEFACRLERQLQDAPLRELITLSNQALDKNSSPLTHNTREYDEIEYPQ